VLRLALNRLSEDSRWDLEALRLEFSDIMEISGEIDLRISGFEMGEIDVAFEASEPPKASFPVSPARRAIRSQASRATVVSCVRATVRFGGTAAPRSSGSAARINLFKEF
jgi:hypothetical protein